MKKLLLMSVLAIAALPPKHAKSGALEQTASLVAPWNAALENGKLDELLALYAKDAMVLLPDGQAIKDPKAILEFWRHLLAARSGRYALDVDKVIYAKDDTVVSTLRWSNLEGDLRYSYDGVIYSVFKRQPDGSWKAQVQRWN